MLDCLWRGAGSAARCTSPSPPRCCSAPTTRRRWMAVVMASKSKRSRYRGALASPIVRQPPPSFWGAVTPKRLNEYYRSVARHERNQAKEIERHLSRRFSLLFDYYGIKDRRNTRALAWALAREHVKGFQLVKPTNKKRGRRSVWDGKRLEQLLNTVESVQRAHPKFTDRRALRFMITTEPYSAIWAPSENHKGSKDQWLETLESRLQQAKSIKKQAKQLEEELRQISQKI
jgi:hypothetical protein